VADGVSVSQVITPITSTTRSAGILNSTCAALEQSPCKRELIPLSRASKNGDYVNRGGLMLAIVLPQATVTLNSFLPINRPRTSRFLSRRAATLVSSTLATMIWPTSSCTSSKRPWSFILCVWY
jgi:hypothetical protein